MQRGVPEVGTLVYELTGHRKVLIAILLLIDGRARAVSNTSALTTPAHSHYQGNRPTPSPAPPSLTPSPSGRTPAETRTLSNLWLQSAATFRRWGKLEQALGAIQEAEVVDAENPEVWLQVSAPG